MTLKKTLKALAHLPHRRIVKAIDTKLTGQPMQFGAPLSGNLSDFRKLRVGDYRVVYQVQKKVVLVYVLPIVA